MDFLQENKRETERLCAILNRIGAKEWTLNLGGGWTVGTQLCHLSFWDKTTALRLRIWMETARLAAILDKENIDTINDSVRHLTAGIDFREGVRLVAECARDIDALVSQLKPEQISELETSGRERWFKRYFHRQAHLPRIETVLNMQSD